MQKTIGSHFVLLVTSFFLALSPLQAASSSNQAKSGTSSTNTIKKERATRDLTSPVSRVKIVPTVAVPAKYETAKQ